MVGIVELSHCFQYIVGSGLGDYGGALVRFIDDGMG